MSEGNSDEQVQPDAKPIKATPKQSWSEEEVKAICDPRMMEFENPNEFAKEMASRTGVIRSVGGYFKKLSKLQGEGLDVNRTLFVNLRKAMESEYSSREGTEGRKTNGAKTNGAKANSHKANGAKPNGAKPNGFSGSKGASKSSHGSREWVSIATMAWLLGVSTKRIYQISSGLHDDRIRRKLMNPGSAQPAYTYSVGDAITYLQSDARLQSRFATISEVKEILGFTSDAHTKKVVSTFTDPNDHSRIRRADVLFLWMNSPRSPATESDAKKIIAGAAIDAVTKKKMTNVKPVRVKPVTAKVAKPVKKVQPRVAHPVSAIMTPEQVSPRADRQPQQQNAADFEWMLEGMRRGHIDENDVSQMLVKMAKR